ncbi:MAG TPA: 50S ribosomal protein L11 methyltransferase, partial [Pyrinomonadaceae bacterium]|nr:50S ribosomal protein L11 methyltransferase [Pyrinomonadaceae bacterium]
MNSKQEIIKWFAVEITVAPEAAEAVEYAFNSLESLGTEINHLRKKEGESVVVIGYFNELPDDEILQDEIHYALRIYSLSEDAVVEVKRRDVEDRDWLIEWKKHWKPTTIAGFIISPPWEKVVDAGKIVIYIEP